MQIVISGIDPKTLMEAFVAELQKNIKQGKADFFKQTEALPKLGEYWHGQGGHFVGTVFDPAGMHYHLIVGPEMEGEGKWKKSLDWAKSLEIDGHKDFELPNRREARFLQCNGKQFFKDETYWLSEQVAGNDSVAWAQFFDDGDQGWLVKGGDFRARAVRRLVI